MLREGNSFPLSHKKLIQFTKNAVISIIVEMTAREKPDFSVRHYLFMLPDEPHGLPAGVADASRIKTQDLACSRRPMASGGPASAAGRQPGADVATLVSVYQPERRRCL